ncbi:MAG: hypothetical protein ABMA13_00885 [Chthoniobacteraceae bacterium]
MPTKFRPCVFCASGNGKTADHIPPLGFFPKPRPSNLVTVPSCESCRVRYQEDDEHVRNLLVSLAQTENHPAIEPQIAEARNRSFDYAVSKAKRLISMMRLVKVGTTGSTASAFNLDDPMLDRFLERVCRGVLYDAHRIPFFPASFAWQLMPPHEAGEHFNKAPVELARKEIDNVFAYICSDEPVESFYYVSLRFYESFFALGRLQPVS